MNLIINFIRHDRAAVPCARDDGDAGGHRVLLRVRREEIAYVSVELLRITTPYYYYILLLYMITRSPM